MNSIGEIMIEVEMYRLICLDPEFFDLDCVGCPYEDQCIKFCDAIICSERYRKQPIAEIKREFETIICG